MPNLQLVELVVGFIALRTFYFIGLPGRRTDLELTLWSLVVAVAIGVVLDELGIADPAARFGVGCLIAVVGGYVGARGFLALAKRQERLRAAITPRAWDLAVEARRRDGPASDPEAPWVQVQTTSGINLRGWVKSHAVSAETDELDVFLAEPARITEDGIPEPLEDVEGVLIPEHSIDVLYVFAASAAPDRS